MLAAITSPKFSQLVIVASVNEFLPTIRPTIPPPYAFTFMVPLFLQLFMFPAEEYCPHIPPRYEPPLAIPIIPVFSQLIILSYGTVGEVLFIYPIIPPVFVRPFIFALFVQPVILVQLPAYPQIPPAPLACVLE